MLNNTDLFIECLKHKVPNIDKMVHDTLNRRVIPLDESEPSELLARNSKLVELLTKFNNLNAAGDTSKNNEIIDEMDECLKYDGMNLCPFSQYLMVHDLIYDIYINELSHEEKAYIISSYLNDRHQMYLNHDYSDIIFQVMADNYSHKRKAVIGVEKLKKACEKYKIKHFDGNYEKNFYLLPDNGDKDDFKNVLEKYHIKFKFAEEHQDKMPDAFIKYNNIFIIIEHKRMKTGGGGQDKQITEIIDFIKYDERDVYYISYLDGILFNKLINPPSRQKLYKAKQNILDNLAANPYNYFVNEYGFNKLIDYIVNNN